MEDVEERRKRDKTNEQGPILENSNCRASMPTIPDSTSGSKDFPCNICGKSFVRKSNLTQHMLVHTGERKLKCEICEKSFTTGSNLKKHMDIHTGKKSYTCEICGKAFSMGGNLRRHMNGHTGAKTFKCEVCGNKFSQSDSLCRHMVIHAGVKNFKCETCGKMFCRKGDLTKHADIHTGVKKYKCNSCDKYFARSSHLSAHMLIHVGVKKYECEICKKKFPRKGDLTQHAAVHTGAKNFQCEFCGKSFGRNSFLVTHRKVHNGIKNFECGNCGKFFSQKGNLKNHMKTHGGVGTMISHPEVLESKAPTAEDDSVVTSKISGASKILSPHSVTTVDTEYRRKLRSCSSPDIPCNMPGTFSDNLENEDFTACTSDNEVTDYNLCDGAEVSSTYESVEFNNSYTNGDEAVEVSGGLEYLPLHPITSTTDSTDYQRRLRNHSSPNGLHMPLFFDYNTENTESTCQMIHDELPVLFP